MNNPPISTDVSNAQLLDAINNLRLETNEKLDNINEKLDNINEKLDNICSRLGEVEFLLNRMSNQAFANLPVLGSEHRTLRTTNSSTYTWVKYSGHTGLIGAAHCALLYGTNHNDKLFINLPESITQLGVRCVHLVRPFDVEFSNLPLESTKTLPTKYDIIFIQVGSQPPETKLPEFEKSTPGKKKIQHHSPLVGRSPVSVVSSKDGVVNVDTNEKSLGSISFFLDRGEPGDSGTLLLLKKDGNLAPRAVFTGIEGTRPGYGRRGLAATLPDQDQFVQFPILDLETPEHLHLTSLRLVDWGPSNGLIRRNVTITRMGLNAVNCCFDDGTVMAHGVIVKSSKCIGYIGKKDMKLMGDSTSQR